MFENIKFTLWQYKTSIAICRPVSTDIHDGARLPWVLSAQLSFLPSAGWETSLLSYLSNKFVDFDSFMHTW